MFRSLLLASLVPFALVSGARADAPTWTPLKTVAYAAQGKPAGVFVALGSGRWIEVSGKLRFEFSEISRDAGSVYLLKGDGAHLRLDTRAEEVSIRHHGQGPWVKLYDISTSSVADSAPGVDATVLGTGVAAVTYPIANDATGGVFAKVSDREWMEWNRVGEFRFTELARSAGSVHLQKSDGARVEIDIRNRRVQLTSAGASTGTTLYSLTRVYGAPAPTPEVVEPPRPAPPVIQKPSQPNLTGEFRTVERDGTQVTLRLAVRNDGGVTSNGTTALLVLAPAPKVDLRAANHSLLGRVSIRPLAAGHETEVTLTVGLDLFEGAGTHIVAVIDHDARVPETDESDNQAATARPTWQVGGAPKAGETPKDAKDKKGKKGKKDGKDGNDAKKSKKGKGGKSRS